MPGPFQNIDPNNPVALGVMKSLGGQIFPKPTQTPDSQEAPVQPSVEDAVQAQMMPHPGPTNLPSIPQSGAAQAAPQPQAQLPGNVQPAGGVPSAPGQANVGTDRAARDAMVAAIRAAKAKAKKKQPETYDAVEK